MRRTGFVDAVDGLGQHDHICWVFHTLEQFRQAAGRFLTDGVAAGQQAIYLAEGASATELDHVAGFAAARMSGAAVVQDLGIYEPLRPIDAAAQVAEYERATDQALAAGFTGLRVAAQVTPLVRTPAQLDAFTRYEHHADALMIRRPFSAMCGYHAGELSAAAVAELASMHPLATPGSTPLRMFPSARPEVTAVLAGEVDLAGRRLLHDVLRRVDLTPVDGAVTIDARDLTFLDHRGLFQLADQVRARGATTVLHVAERSPVRLVAELLALPDVRLVMS
ncbi:MEDS domain-containing protein [Catellatospora methionotrophica]|uniref:MEDS domain-containing protein n=1 Tax=Catellatospora methionotrophica TaxID=121620 RepID=UPI0033DB11B2